MSSPPIDIRDRTPYAVGQFCVKEGYEDDLDRILLSEGEVESRIECVAEDVSRFYGESADAEIALVCVLQGAMRFFQTLSPQLEFPMPSSHECVRAGRYTGGEARSTQTDIRLLDASAVEGKDVLIVEDMIDEGHTLDDLVERVEAAGPNSVEVAVLLDKASARRAEVDVAFTGFIIPDEFVVGYGIDYDENYRDLRHVGVLKETVR